MNGEGFEVFARLAHRLAGLLPSNDPWADIAEVLADDFSADVVVLSTSKSTGLRVLAQRLETDSSLLQILKRSRERRLVEEVLRSGHPACEPKSEAKPIALTIIPVTGTSQIIAAIVLGQRTTEAGEQLTADFWQAASNLASSTIARMLDTKQATDANGASSGPALGSSTHSDETIVDHAIVDQVISESGRSSTPPSDTEGKAVEKGSLPSPPDLVELVDGVGVGVMFRAVDGRYTFINRTACELLEVIPEEILGKRSLAAHVQIVDENRELISTEDLPSERTWFEGQPLSKVTFGLRMRATGDIRWMLTSTQLHYHADSGEPQGVLVTFQDITERKQAEDRLRESEERFRRVFEQSPVGISIIEWPTRRHLSANEAYCRMLGYTQEELQQLSVLEVTHPDDHEADKATTVQQQGELTSFSREKRYIRKDGEIVYAVLHGSVIRDSGDKPLYGIGIVEDITERKRAEQKLRDSEQQFRLLFEQCPVGIVLVELPSFRIAQANATICAMLKYTEKELTQLTTQTITHPKDLERALQFDARVAKGDEPCISMEKRYLAKDGETIWSNLTSSIIYDHSGQPMYGLGIIEDISQRKKAEQAIQQEHQQLVSLFDSVDEIIYVADPNTYEILYCNEAFRKCWGDPTGKKCFALLQNSDHPCDFCTNDQVLGEKFGETCVWEFRNQSNHRWYRCIDKGILWPDGRKVRYEMACDISDQKEAERALAEAKHEAEAANRAKSHFLANMSHEIRTPMTAILGYTDLLLNFDLSLGEQASHLETIHRNAESLLKLTNDILDLSKIEADKLIVERVDCSPWRIAEDVVSVLQVRALEKQIQLEIEAVPPFPETIHTDPVRLRQILINLVGNAVKFTEKGSVRLALRCRDDAPGHRQMLFEVTDTGIGMTEEELAHLFQPFTQVDMSTTRRFGGTGLGLTISQRMAEKLGGYINVASHPKRGSTFLLTIDAGPTAGVPLHTSLPAAKSTSGISGTAPPSPHLAGHVLLAEDGPDVQKLVKISLEQVGLTVDVASDGRIAYQKAMASLADIIPYDVVLMDIQMPILDGYEATQRLRAHGYRGPIIALTAHAMSGDREKCLSAGCDDYVAKPLSRSELIELVAKYVRKIDLPEDTPGNHPPDLAHDSELRELMNTFARELPDRAECIHHALQSGDFERVANLTHQLKGSAGLYGFPEIANLARRINRLAVESADDETLHSTVAELRKLCAQAAEDHQAL